MAVVQISRIQIRRGRALSGTGIPQLASGELAWSLDTQELYIGNGSVAEGAPGVGNTKVLTERDLTIQGNLLDLIQHVYKLDNPAIQTGDTPNTPVFRTLQSRLDDRVNAFDFGAVGDGVADDTAALQRAINELFLNLPKASAESIAGSQERVLLEIPAGTYLTTDTLYIPSYATIVGTGRGKSIINHTGTGSAIRFVNDSSSIDNPSDIGSTLANTQPRSITLNGLTIITSTSTQSALQLDAVTNSLFENLIIQGNWGGSYNSSSRGISMSALSSIVTCSNNIFKRIAINGFSFGVYAKQDILTNSFSEFYINDTRFGFSLGFEANGSSVGEQYGPRETYITDCRFEDIKRTAIYVGLGSGTVVSTVRLSNVGNDGGGFATSIYPQIYFDSPTNTVENIYSDRSTVLSNPAASLAKRTLTLSGNVTAVRGALVQQATSGATGYIINGVTNSNTIEVNNLSIAAFDTSHDLTIDGDATPSVTNGAVHPSIVGAITSIPYVPEATGRVKYKSHGTRRISIGQISSPALAFRVPVVTDQYGDPLGSIMYKIEYLYRSASGNFSRSGVLSVVADIDNSIIRVTDEYDFVGTDPDGTICLKLDFIAELLNETGSTITPALTEIPYSIAIKYTNSLISDVGYLEYSYIAIS